MTVIAPTVVYPSLISRACAALDESPVFKDVPDGTSVSFCESSRKST